MKSIVTELCTSTPECLESLNHFMFHSVYCSNLADINTEFHLLRIELMEIVLKPCGIAKNEWLEPDLGEVMTVLK